MIQLRWWFQTLEIADEMTGTDEIVKDWGRFHYIESSFLL